MIKDLMASGRPGREGVEEVKSLFRRLFKASRVNVNVRDGVAFISVDSGRRHLADLRFTSELAELYVLTRESGLDVLKELGFEEIWAALKDVGTPAEVVISKSPASRSIYLLVSGEPQRMPNVRVVVRGESYEAVASYCRLGEGEDTCEILRRLVKACKLLWNEFYGDANTQ